MERGREKGGGRRVLTWKNVLLDEVVSVCSGSQLLLQFWRHNKKRKREKFRNNIYYTARTIATVLDTIYVNCFYNVVDNFSDHPAIVRN